MAKQHLTLQTIYTQILLLDYSDYSHGKLKVGHYHSITWNYCYLYTVLPYTVHCTVFSCFYFPVSGTWEGQVMTGADEDRL